MLEVGQHRADGLAGLLVGVGGQHDLGRRRFGEGHVDRPGLAELVQQPAQRLVPVGVPRDPEHHDDGGSGVERLDQGEVGAAEPAGQVHHDRAELVDLGRPVPHGGRRQREHVVAVGPVLHPLPVVPVEGHDGRGPGAGALDGPQLGVGGVPEAGEGLEQGLLQGSRHGDRGERWLRVVEADADGSRLAGAAEGCPLTGGGQEGGQLGQGQCADVGQSRARMAAERSAHRDRGGGGRDDDGDGSQGIVALRLRDHLRQGLEGGATEGGPHQPRHCSDVTQDQ